MCVCVCVCLCLCACVRVCVSVCLSVCLPACLPAYDCVRVYAFLCICVHALQRDSTGGPGTITPTLMKAVRSVDLKLKFVPTLYIFLRIWGTIRVFFDVAEYNTDPNRAMYKAFLYLQVSPRNDIYTPLSPTQLDSVKFCRRLR